MTAWTRLQLFDEEANIINNFLKLESSLHGHLIGDDPIYSHV